jgi:hypothetical protein
MGRYVSNEPEYISNGNFISLGEAITHGHPSAKSTVAIATTEHKITIGTGVKGCMDKSSFATVVAKKELIAIIRK